MKGVSQTEFLPGASRWEGGGRNQLAKSLGLFAEFGSLCLHNSGPCFLAGHPNA